MKQAILNFSTPYVSCINCIKTIQNHITKKFNQRFDHFELMNYFQYDLAQKTIQLKVNVSDEYQEIVFLAQQLIDVLALEDIGQEMIFIQQNPYSNIHYYGALLGLLAALFWIVISTGFWILAPGMQVSAVVLSVGLLSWMSSSFFKHAWMQAKLGWNDRTKPFFNMDSLFVSTGLLIICSSICNFFFPWLPNLLEAGFLIFGFRHLGIIFQSYLDKKIGFSRSLVEMFQYRKYQLYSNMNTIYAKDLEVRQRFSVQKGEIVPVDAQLIAYSDDFEIRDMLETGSYQLLSVAKMKLFLAGAECVAGQAVFEVSQVLQQSRFARMDQSIASLVQSQQKSPILNRLDDWLQWFIPGIFLISMTSFLVVSQFFPIATAFTCALSVLVSACPCTLGLIVPMALRMGAYKSSAEQIFFQSSEALQKAAHVDILVFDYHGTLTQGDWQISEFQCSSMISNQKALQVIYTIESCMHVHPLKKKIIEFIQKQQAHQSLSGQVKDLRYGGKLITDEGDWWFGNSQILEDLNLQNRDEASHRLYLLFQPKSGEPIIRVGFFDVYDPLKKDAKKLINQMREKGTDVRICTGADESTASMISAQLGMDKTLVSYNNHMDDKMKFLKGLKQQYPNQILAMVGDAINDKEALNACDLSIFMINEYNQSYLNTDLKNSVDILVVSDALMNMVHAFQIAHDTMSVIEQNLFLSMMYNVLSLILAAGVFLAWGFSLPPVIGVLLMMTQSVFLLLNTYRVIFKPDDIGEMNYPSFQRSARTET